MKNNFVLELQHSFIFIYGSRCPFLGFTLNNLIAINPVLARELIATLFGNLLLLLKSYNVKVEKTSL